MANFLTKYLQARYAPVVLILLLILAAVVLATARGQDRDDEAIAVLPVVAEAIHYQDSYLVEHHFTGRIAARRQSELSFDLAGTIDAVHVDIGNSVLAGDILAVLDTDRLLASQAALEAERAQLQADLSLARKTLKRTRETYTNGHVSEAALDESEAAVARLEAGLLGVEANLSAVAVDMEKSQIRAPYDGMIDRRLVDEGAVVSQGMPVVRLVESGILEAVIGIPRTFVDGLETGTTVTLVDEDGNSFSATLARIATSIRGDTRTMLVSFDIAENEYLRDGEMVTYGLKKSESASGFWVPLTALTADVRGLWRLYAVVGPEGEQRVVTENVQLLYSADDQVFVTGSVQDGAMIVTNGIARLTPGQRVRVTSGQMVKR